MAIPNDENYDMRTWFLRGIMNDRGVSVTELARRTRMSRKAISQIVNGRKRPHRSSERRIAEALGVSWMRAFLVSYLEAERESVINEPATLLNVPRPEDFKPDRERLDIRYEMFRDAG